MNVIVFCGAGGGGGGGGVCVCAGVAGRLAFVYTARITVQSNPMLRFKMLISMHFKICVVLSRLLSK